MLSHVVFHLLFLLLIQLCTIVIVFLLLTILIETVELVIIIIIFIIQLLVVIELSGICLGHQFVFFAILLVEFLLFFSSELLPQMVPPCLCERHDSGFFLRTLSQPDSTIGSSRNNPSSA